MQCSDRIGSESSSQYFSAQQKRLTNLWTKVAYPKIKRADQGKMDRKIRMENCNKTTMDLLANIIVKQHEGQLENINFYILVVHIFFFFFFN